MGIPWRLLEVAVFGDLRALHTRTSWRKSVLFSKKNLFSIFARVRKQTEAERLRQRSPNDNIDFVDFIACVFSIQPAFEEVPKIA